MFSYGHYIDKNIFGYLEDWYLGKSHDGFKLKSNRNDIFGCKSNIFLGFVIKAAKKKKKGKKASIESLVPLLCVAHSAASFPTYPHLRFPNFHTFTLQYQKFAGNTQKLPLTK